MIPRGSGPPDAAALLPPLPLATEPLKPNQEVLVQDRRPMPGHSGGPFTGLLNPIRTGLALSPSQINVSGEPGSSGAGVVVTETVEGREQYALAGLIVSRTPLPPQFHERKTVPLPDGTPHHLNIYLSGRWNTNIVPASVIREFLADAENK